MMMIDEVGLKEKPEDTRLVYINLMGHVISVS